MAAYYNQSDIESIVVVDGRADDVSQVESIASSSPSRDRDTRMEDKTTPVVNILLLGKVGVGKARIINEMFQKAIFECRAVTEVLGGVSQREKVFSDDRIKYKVKIFDTVGINSKRPRIMISKTMSAMREYVSSLYPNGVNLILLAYRHEDWTETERKRFLYILYRINEETIPLITALVITGCANKNDSARKKIISEFDSHPRTQVIGRYVLQGVYVVGFTDISSASDAMTEMYHAVNYRDALPLKELMDKCCTRQEDVENFFYRGHGYRGFLECPWHLCPCYSRVYTCLRWGYTWEECFHLENHEENS